MSDTMRRDADEEDRAADATPPAGFLPLFRTSPVLDLIGPLYYMGHGPGLVVGLLAGEKHCNSRGTVHGGILAAMADVALGYALAFSSVPPANLVTASLSLDFAGTAKPGDWIESAVDVQKQNGRLWFANCYLSVGAQRIVRASAVFAAAGSVGASV